MAKSRLEVIEVKVADEFSGWPDKEEHYLKVDVDKMLKGIISQIAYSKRAAQRSNNPVTYKLGYHEAIKKVLAIIKTEAYDG